VVLEVSSNKCKLLLEACHTNGQYIII